jgi:hypothetical protein
VIVLTAQQTANLLWRTQFHDAQLRPRRLSDGRYALPEAVLTDPRHTRWRSLLKQGSIEAVGGLTFTPPVNGADYSVSVDGKEMYLQVGAIPETYGMPVPDLFDIPAANLYRFEAHQNRGDPTAGDRFHNRRRVELIQMESDGYGDGDTVWTSWSTVLTDARAGFVGENGTLIHQWHGSNSSSGPGPVFWITLRGGDLEVHTRSDIDAWVAHEHYSQPFAPATGTPVNFVVSGLLGGSGHLNVWMDGVQIVNVDTPIGGYIEALPTLAFTQFGVYMDNIASVDVLYHANVEYGLTDLSARIASPVSVTAPPGGWV